MNDLFLEYGLGPWKSVVASMLLPPVPLLLISLWGAWLLAVRRSAGWFLVLLACVGMWLSACAGTGQALGALLLKTPPALPLAQVAELKRNAAGRRSTAIVVLGGGREVYAPEYGVSSLGGRSLERLRYGLWLAKETGLPVAFSGGVGWSQSDGLAEAQIAARIASSEFGRPLRWVEEGSRDTRENATRSVALLGPAGINEIVLVTHGWHMRRALRAFEDAGGGRYRIVPAPMGLAAPIDRAALLWLPSSEGYTLVRDVLREALGWLAGS